MDERPPSWPVVLAVASVVAAASCLAFTAVTVHWAGWVLGSLLTASLVVLYRVADRQASRSVRYLRNPTLNRLANVLLICGILLGSVNAFWIATELAK